MTKAGAPRLPLARVLPGRAAASCRALPALGVPAAAGLCLLLASCRVGPDFQRPQARSTDGYFRAGAAPVLPAVAGLAQRLAPGAEVPAQWWKLFGSAHLDAQVEAALAHNPSLQAATFSLRQSEALLRAGNGVFYPQIALGASVLRERGAPTAQGVGGTASVFNLFTLGATVSYSLDVFGGERRNVEGLQAEMANQFYLAQAAWLTVSSNVVNTSIARAAYVAELAATESLVGLEQQQLRLAEEGERTGYLAYAAVLALRGQLSTTLATRAPLRQKISAADHLLATLQGITPADQALPEVTLEELVLPHDLPLTLPAVLLRQRPDVLSAEATLHASNAAIGVATAALFPQITLDGSGGMAASRFAGLSQAGQRYWTIGPSLSLPLFNGGILHAQLDAAHQTEQQSEALYRQTVLAALAQVADVLAALTHDAEALQALADAQADACAALALLQSGYATGLVAWSDVLVSDGQCRQAAIARIEAVAQRQQDSVALFMALGGGWWNDEERNRALLQDASGPPATGGVP